METKTENQRPNNGQLISVPHRDTVRLLEVYVKRSLSLNDGALEDKSPEKKQKWVTKRQRRHSSDPSLHLAEGLSLRESDPVDEPPANEPPANQTKPHPEEPVSEKSTKKSKKNKKPSFWKVISGFFSRKSNDNNDEQDSPSETAKDSATDESDAGTNCLPTTPVAQQKKKSMRRKSIKRRFSKKRLSLIKPNKPDITEIEAVVSVEPTDCYYEKMSEELQKIVHEVKEKEEEKPLSDEEVINRIIALTKEQGDAIDDKLKDNPTLSSFFQRMSYSSFQRLADAYLEKEATPTNNPPTILPTAPELVKLAFTLDFTARIAGLSKQNVCHITGLGNRYLTDLFEYKQACTDHPWSDSDD